MEFLDSDSDCVLPPVYDSSDMEPFDFCGRISSRTSISPTSFGHSHTKSRKREPRCYNKNAVNARENRRKNKEYLKNIECEVIRLRKENENLKKKHLQQSHAIKSLSKENSYLKNVINNTTSINTLLTGLNKVLQNPVESQSLQPDGTNAQDTLLPEWCKGRHAVMAA